MLKTLEPQVFYELGPIERARKETLKTSNIKQNNGGQPGHQSSCFQHDIGSILHSPKI